MSYIIEGAKPSPRILNGNIYWYEGDTFSIPLTIDIGTLREGINISKGNTVVLNFFNTAGTLVFYKNATVIENNTVQFEISGTETSKLPAGRYRMKILHENSEGRVTVAPDVRVIVE